ncbi:hypothetical protein [Mycobacteroides abscessus]|uniref:hypothetical protein n=1 Tax=Mycobacteroides abscessus TaxID=36809 RepID=UPI0009A778A3|nr:hypothetical protein [Mycobacteroides abscessus]SLH40953.1 Uncharacterised protein [Mycobacteroides abscessus subsp. massiliense]
MKDREAEPASDDYAARAMNYRRQAREFRERGDQNMANVCETFGKRCDELAASQNGDKAHP